MKPTRLVLALAVSFLIAGCGDDDPDVPSGPLPTATVAPAGPTPTPTLIPKVPTPAVAAIGPQITFIGITRADDVLVPPVETSPDGVPIFMRLAGATGRASGFRLVVEGKPGSSGEDLGLSTFNDFGTELPDLQIQANRPLGNGSSAVCDNAQPTPGPTPGGVPAIDPPSFEASSVNANTINDLACRFRDGIGATMGISNSIDGCVKIEPTEDYGFVDETSTAQFCGFVSAILTFAPGDTLLTVRLRDLAGNVGEPAQMIIRVN